MARRNVGKNNVKTSAKGKNIKKNKKKNKVKKFFALLLFWIIILGILAGIGFGIYYIFTSDNLKMKNIKVEKTNYYSEEQVVETASIPKDTNMLLVRRRKIKNKVLKELPYIEDMKIKIGKEGTLRIVVKERTAKYVVNNKDTNEYVRVDKYGIMLEKVSAENILPEEMPLFGLSLDKEEILGKSIPETEYTKIQRFETIYQEYLNAKIDMKVTSVKFQNSKIILTLDYKTEVVTEVSENLAYKMSFLKEILKEVAGRGGRIDLTLDNPTFVEKIG